MELPLVRDTGQMWAYYLPPWFGVCSLGFTAVDEKVASLHPNPYPLGWGVGVGAPDPKTQLQINSICAKSSGFNKDRVSKVPSWTFDL